ncbi:hypothetical protein K0M31_010498 [Melipona bicolor]|uniref:Uncharacterized protein n=1 Tax=Melipona bicolor TaxID=60889 RepID=A0AA40KI78_9HYME|nr:hypothetical protein K0M31_010498 [Melipona bicolor]
MVYARLYSDTSPMAVPKDKAKRQTLSEGYDTCHTSSSGNCKMVEYAWKLRFIRLSSVTAGVDSAILLKAGGTIDPAGNECETSLRVGRPGTIE